MGIANILSWTEEEFCNTYDIVSDDGLIVHKSDRSKCLFVPWKRLLYSDVEDDAADILVTAVDANKYK